MAPPEFVMTRRRNSVPQTKGIGRDLTATVPWSIVSTQTERFIQMTSRAWPTPRRSRVQRLARPHVNVARKSFTAHYLSYTRIAPLWMMTVWSRGEKCSGVTAALTCLTPSGSTARH